jgi:N-acetyl-anhydromuramoyl-L-alanine amidase
MASATTRRFDRLIAVPQRSAWNAGWWRGAAARHSPNFGPRPTGVVATLAVVHAISLPPGQWGGDAVERFFTNTLDVSAHPYFLNLRDVRVSAHFFVRRSGRVLQFVSCEHRAWHAGISRWQGRDNCNDWSIGIELEGLDGQAFDARQYPALARLLRVLSQRYALTEAVGHEHIAPGRKFDPGPGFDWRRLRRAMPGCRPQLMPCQRPLSTAGL